MFFPKIKIHSKSSRLSVNVASTVSTACTVKSKHMHHIAKMLQQKLTAVLQNYCTFLTGVMVWAYLKLE